MDRNNFGSKIYGKDFGQNEFSGRVRHCMSTTAACDYDADRILRVVGSPVLVVLPSNKEKELQTSNTIHLLGVSHGSPPSARLVRNTISNINSKVDMLRSKDSTTSTKDCPVVIALELCDDRYLSISLESQVEPRSGNTTLNEIYWKKISSLQTKKDDEIVLFGMKNLKDSETGRFLLNVNAFFRFVKTQGVLLGLFVAMGILVKELQSMFHSSARLPSSVTAPHNVSSIENFPIPGEDEFATAMRMAAALDFPVRMSDANQADTLSSIRGVVSADTVNPVMVAQGAQSLAFSALGLEMAPKDSTQLTASSSTSNMNSNTSPVSEMEFLRSIYGELRPEWINIPAVYAENWNMVKSLLPLALIAVVSAVIGAAANALDANGIGPIPQTLEMFPPTQLDLATILPDTLMNSPERQLLSSWITPVASKVADVLMAISAALDTELTPAQEAAINVVVETFSGLLLIRLAKIIGSDRDKIIASKVMSICREFPGSEVVVVIGMLHCNGVAKYLASGVDPLAVDK